MAEAFAKTLLSSVTVPMLGTCAAPRARSRSRAPRRTAATTPAAPPPLDRGDDSRDDDSRVSRPVPAPEPSTPKRWMGESARSFHAAGVSRSARLRQTRYGQGGAEEDAEPFGQVLLRISRRAAGQVQRIVEGEQEGGREGEMEAEASPNPAPPPRPPPWHQLRRRAMKEEAKGSTAAAMADLYLAEVKRLAEQRENIDQRVAALRCLLLAMGLGSQSHGGPSGAGSREHHSRPWR